MAKAGRKRRQGVKRQPNGQVARVSIRESATAVVVEARMRHYGCTKEQAKTELAGYAIGRMALNGDFGVNWQPAIDAVYDYVTATADYMRIKCPLMPFPKAMDYLAGRGSSLAPEPSLKTVSRIESRYTGLLATLEKADSMDRIYFHQAAFDDFVFSERAKQGVVNCVDVLLGR